MIKINVKLNDKCYLYRKSQLLHANHIDWLDFFIGFDWIENVVGEDLGIFNDTT